MEKKLHVLIVEDSEDDTRLMVRSLRQGGYEPIYHRVETADEMRQQLEGNTWDIVLADYRMPRFSGLQALQLLQETGVDLPFIIVSGTIGEETAVAAMKAGAHDYLMKSNLTRLAPAVERELRDAEGRFRRRKAEEQVRENEARLRAIVGSMAEAMIVVDGENRVVVVNPAAERLFGLSSGDLLNRPLEAGIQNKLLLNGWRKILAQPDKEGQFEFELPRGEGAPRYLRARTSGIRDPSGRSAGVVTTFFDLTRERELDRMKTEFITTAAHELRTPLTSVLGFSELLLTRREPGEEEERRFLHHILEEAQALSRIVGDLLDVSRIESGQPLPLHKAPCNLPGSHARSSIFSGTRAPSTASRSPCGRRSLFRPMREKSGRSWKTSCRMRSNIPPGAVPSGSRVKVATVVTESPWRTKESACLQNRWKNCSTSSTAPMPPPRRWGAWAWA